MIIGVPKESQVDETRVALAPASIKKLLKKKLVVQVASGAGLSAGFSDDDYAKEGAVIQSDDSVWKADVLFKVRPPTLQEVERMKRGALLISLLEPYRAESPALYQKLAAQGVDAMALERIPRTSRAQSMDVLSSQANIAGYRAVLEATAHYGRFFPLMMTSAGSAKPARVMVLGAGVAGLQAIAVARKLGAVVEAYDIRQEVKEQILSLGAKVVELDVGEEGSGQGGYAKELSSEAKEKQQKLLTERLMKCDVIVSTANIPGKKAPILITEEAVRGMRRGSVIVDMAAGNGGNCPLSKPDQVVHAHGVIVVGHTNYPAKVASDASAFYGGNLVSLIGILLDEKSEMPKLHLNLQDDIIAASLVIHNGAVRT